MEQYTRFYILLHLSTTSFSLIHFPLFALFFVDPGLVLSVVFSPAIITVPVLSSASVVSVGNILTVSLLSLMTDSVILIPSLVPCVNVVVFGDV